jgi:hypothetical protein
MQKVLEKKRPGPVPGVLAQDNSEDSPEMVRTSIMLELGQLEWAKRQPGGLSALVRRLIKENQEGGAK